MSQHPARPSTVGLAALNALGPISFDLYLPAWPALAAHFACGTGEIALSLSAFLLGYAIGQIVYGPLSDCLGRRPFITFGGVLYLLSSLACLFADRLETFVALRFIQGLGGSAGMVMTRAIIRDTYAVDAAAKLYSQLMCTAMLVTLLSPLLGAALLQALGWRALFVALAGCGLMMIFVAARLPETWPPEARHRWSLSMLTGAYRNVATHREFLGYALTATSIFTGLFTYLSTAPYLLMQVNGVRPEHFGYYFGVNLVAQALMFFLNGHLVAKLGAEAVLRVGLLSAAGAALAMIAGARYGSGWYGGIGIPLLWFLSSMTLIIGNAMAGGMRYFPTLAGTAAALSGAMQSVVAAVAGAAIGLVENGTPWPLTWSIATCTLAALSSYHLIARRLHWRATRIRAR